MSECIDSIDSYIEINSVITHIIHFGLKQSIHLYNDVLNDLHVLNHPIIVLMISGNPGEVGYYRDLMSNIYGLTKLPVIGLSHAGHNRVPKHHTIPDITENIDLYSLNGQIYHKKCFIEKYISSQSKLILIGHSIGTYIILELLNRYQSIRSKVLHSILIFPTIESIGDTSEGIKYQFLFEWFKYPLLGISYVLNQLLNDYYKLKLVSFVMRSEQDLPECVVRSATNLLDPKCLRALIEMSLIEFKTVKELNREAIDRNEKRLTFLYGECDQWCPIQYYTRINQLYPKSDIRLCLGDMNHAFVINKQSTIKVSQIVVHIIESILQKQ